MDQISVENQSSRPSAKDECMSFFPSVRSSVEKQNRTRIQLLNYTKFCINLLHGMDQICVQNAPNRLLNKNVRSKNYMKSVSGLYPISYSFGYYPKKSKAIENSSYLVKTKVEKFSLQRKLLIRKNFQLKGRFS